jgi:hypothetical protein
VAQSIINLPSFLSIDLFETGMTGHRRLVKLSGQQSAMSRPNDLLPRHNQAFVELPVMSDIFGLAYLVGQIED